MNEQPYFFVLDGPDAAGKTTLAQAIQKRLGPQTVYIHMTYIKDDNEMLETLVQALRQIRVALSEGHSVVLDRAWMSENIYSFVYRSYSGLGLEARALHRIVMSLKGFYVHCFPDPQSAVERHAKSHAEREEMYKPDAKILEIADVYHRLFFGSDNIDGLLFQVCHQDPDNYALGIAASENGMQYRLHSMRYNIDQWQNRSLTEYLDLLFLAARQWQRAQSAPQPSWWVGCSPVKAKVIVGINSMDSTSQDLFVLTTSRRFKHKAWSRDLALKGWDEEDVCWIKVNWDTRPMLEALYEEQEQHGKIWVCFESLSLSPFTTLTQVPWQTEFPYKLRSL